MADYTGRGRQLGSWYYSWVCFIHHQPPSSWVIGRCGVALGIIAILRLDQTIQQISLARHEKDEQYFFFPNALIFSKIYSILIIYRNIS